MVDPWATMHGIDPEYITCWEYDLPDPDKAKRAGQEATALERLTVAITTMRAAGVVVTQATVDALAQSFGVTTPVALDHEAPEPVDTTPAETDAAPAEPTAPA